MKLATTSCAIGKIVYQYLKRKGKVVPPNLVEDDLGNIIYDPQVAMNTIASNWDSVFSVNTCHDHEMTLLKQVWPYIHDKGKSIELPPITEDQLWKQAAKRRPDAAAGLDGWQTREVQALPPVAFRPVATLFNQIEAGSEEFPTILTQVRMVIHNKDGSDAPLSKRLISLQSVFTLIYTGLRFSQLQHWQRTVLPPQLKGGIKGRNMSEVHMTIQTEVDKAHSFNGSFAGLKLDKAKCFDRLMPRLCAAIFLALGLPRCFVCGFLGLYSRMTRFLSFKQWTRSQAISTPNGVVQGCSLSLLCINVHMAVWVWIIGNIDGIDFRAFIDDTYIWTRLPSINNLVAAVRATELWDSICGQFLNASKCEIFATTGPLRKALKLAFPSMRLVESVNILGAHVQTTCKNAGSFPVNKVLPGSSVPLPMLYGRTGPCGDPSICSSALSTRPTNWIHSSTGPLPLLLSLPDFFNRPRWPGMIGKVYTSRINLHRNPGWLNLGKLATSWISRGALPLGFPSLMHLPLTFWSFHFRISSVSSKALRLTSVIILLV